MSEQIKIRAQAAPWRRGIELYLARSRRNAQGKIEVVTGMTFEEIEDAGITVPYDQVVSILNDDAQELMDDLWHTGLRPTEGSGSAGSLLATEKHLKDMREINTKLLDKVLSND